MTRRRKAPPRHERDPAGKAAAQGAEYIPCDNDAVALDEPVAGKRRGPAEEPLVQVGAVEELVKDVADGAGPAGLGRVRAERAADAAHVGGGRSGEVALDGRDAALVGLRGRVEHERGRVGRAGGARGRGGQRYGVRHVDLVVEPAGGLEGVDHCGRDGRRIGHAGEPLEGVADGLPDGRVVRLGDIDEHAVAVERGAVGRGQAGPGPAGHVGAAAGGAQAAQSGRRRPRVTPAGP